MADDTTGRPDATTSMRVPRSRETTPGTMIDMAAFEQLLAGPDAAGPALEWALRWPSGHVLVVRSEDDALAIARAHPTCRITRRFVPPWRRPGVARA